MGLMTDIANSKEKGMSDREMSITDDIKPIMDIAMVGITGMVALKGVEAISKVV